MKKSIFFLHMGFILGIVELFALSENNYLFTFIAGVSALIFLINSFKLKRLGR